MVTMNINGTEYQLASTLRVAYKLQGMHNHKPYSEIFSGLGSMLLEKQIGVLYCAFNMANPNVLSAQDFQDYVLDNMNLKEVMELLGQLTKEITGADESDTSAGDGAADTGN